jgi:hypothetical protein
VLLSLKPAEAADFTNFHNITNVDEALTLGKVISYVETDAFTFLEFADDHPMLWV